MITLPILNFADIDLPFAIKQYKNDNIANFMCYGKSRMH